MTCIKSFWQSGAVWWKTQGAPVQYKCDRFGVMPFHSSPALHKLHRPSDGLHTGHTGTKLWSKQMRLHGALQRRLETWATKCLLWCFCQQIFVLIFYELCKTITVTEWHYWSHFNIPGIYSNSVSYSRSIIDSLEEYIIFLRQYTDQFIWIMSKIIIIQVVQCDPMFSKDYKKTKISLLVLFI